MLFYPQLITGSVSQYPVTRRNTRRTVVNVAADGSSIRTADDGAATVAWELAYSHLIQSELTGIQQLFSASFGEWQSFTFLDPTDNLLTWSEDLTQASWKADPLLTPAAGVQDPFSGAAAVTLTNSGQINQQIAQTLAIPGSYQYCLSVFLRGDQPSNVELVASSAEGQAHSSIFVSSSWQRAKFSFQMSSQSTELTLGIGLGPGTSVTVFGIQLEAQLDAGEYKKTRDRAGVYPKTRFDGSTLQAIATGLNQYSCTVKMLSAVAG